MDDGAIELGTCPNIYVEPLSWESAQIYMDGAISGFDNGAIELGTCPNIYVEPLM